MKEELRLFNRSVMYRLTYVHMYVTILAYVHGVYVRVTNREFVGVFVLHKDVLCTSNTRCRQSSKCPLLVQVVLQCSYQYYKYKCTLLGYGIGHEKFTICNCFTITLNAVYYHFSFARYLFYKCSTRKNVLCVKSTQICCG